VGTLLALLSSGLWGTSDFLGGTATRRLPAATVAVVSEAFGLLVMLVVAAATGAFGDPTGYVGWALLGAVAGSTGIVAYYQALATGTMGVIAPIASLGVVLPVAVGVVGGDRPSGFQDAGLLVAVLGIVLASGPELDVPDRRRAARPLLLALVAAIAFGVVFVALDRGARTSTTMTLVVMRAGSIVYLTALAAVVPRMGGLRVGARNLPLLAVIGGFDVSANLTFAIASRHGLLSLVSVLSSLYPAVTVVLARSVHTEELRAVQLVGVVAALAGVVLIASG
jgi:drug/metabolite transporter (DMT)-like permease